MEPEKIKKIGEKQRNKSRIYFFCIVLGFYVLIISSIFNGILTKDIPAEFSFDQCVEKYDFVYEDICGDASYYITYPETERINEKLEMPEPIKYDIRAPRCIKEYKTGCGVYADGKI